MGEVGDSPQLRELSPVAVPSVPEAGREVEPSLINLTTKEDAVEFTPLKNLVDEIAAKLAKLTDAPTVFLEAASYWLVSSLLGKFTEFGEGVGGLRWPNLWVILSSAPGLTRRSTVLSLAMKIYRQALLTYLKAKSPLADEEEVIEAINAHIIETGTPEGIIDHIEATPGREFVIISAEFGRILEQITSRGPHAHYTAGTDVLLSKLYYGEPAIQDLSARKGKKQRRYLRPGIYATLLASMQEPWLYIRSQHIRQGLLRRMLLIYVPEEAHDRWLPPIRPELVNKDAILQELAEMLADAMLRLEEARKRERSPYVPLVATQEAVEALNTIAHEADERARQEPTDLNLYRQNEWEVITKLAMLRAIGRWAVAGEVSYIIITPEDVREAQAFYARATQYLRDVFARLGVSFNPRSLGDELLRYVYDLIKEAGSRGLLRSELLRKSRLPAWLLDAVLAQLGKAVQRVVERKELGRPVIRYVAA